jgi:hypothetical protein
MLGRRSTSCFAPVWRKSGLGKRPLSVQLHAATQCPRARHGQTPGRMRPRLEGSYGDARSARDARWGRSEGVPKQQCASSVCAAAWPFTAWMRRLLGSATSSTQTQHNLFSTSPWPSRALSPRARPRSLKPALCRCDVDHLYHDSKQDVPRFTSTPALPHPPLLPSTTDACAFNAFLQQSAGAAPA